MREAQDAARKERKIKISIRRKEEQKFKRQLKKKPAAEVVRAESVASPEQEEDVMMDANKDFDEQDWIAWASWTFILPELRTTERQWKVGTDMATEGILRCISALHKRM